MSGRTRIVHIVTYKAFTSGGAVFLHRCRRNTRRSGTYTRLGARHYRLAGVEMLGYVQRIKSRE
jgi:hypothetical protein